MRIECVTLREIHLPLVQYFETSFVRTDVRKILLIQLQADGVSGWAECTAPENPYYCHETIDTAWSIITRFIVPFILAEQIEHAVCLPRQVKQIRGNNMGKGAVEAGLWDLFARCQSRPLYQMIGGTRCSIDCGVSLGIQEDLEILLDKIDKELAAGYRKIKVKIKPGWDIAVIEKIRAKYPKVPLMVDANGAYTSRDIDWLRQLDDFNLMMIEQPLHYEDLIEHAQLQAQLRTPICLDESIRSYYDARAALNLGSCRVMNIKLGRVGGFAQAKRIHDLCFVQGIPVWCGGMLESGIGRSHNVALSTLPGFTIPGDVSASRRYYQEDTTTHPIEVSPQGQIQVPTGPGTGYEADLPFIDRVTVKEEKFWRNGK
ncbi:MAG: o-succinylbenzoate synthase [Acidobacteria bacterium]|nr:o-succinylbenzoate synthase [Acidobacteriota bacterium]